ncbi:ROK family protein [Halocalculus aciditolerans]|uniref:Glucokinase n=1 Tax=Halocalculus aciditolerans TaxID=1383812 RepID=A0A830FFL3_9EURY|nr:ROK family protein [Halocalculus aciditolerans]GGL69963.1 glucokinase [Halocalculus aciditolerans]
MAYFAGVDLGATNLRAAVANDAGEVLAVERRATPQGPAGIAVTEAVLDAVRDAAASAGIDTRNLAGVGIGSIGPLDLAAGVVEDPANLPPAVERIPLVGPLQELAATDRVFLHNDTAAGVIGERFFSDRNPDDMVYVTISSGIGAGVAVDGHVLSGWDGNAGEVGHMVLDPEGRRTCGCGRDGHWEAYCSGNSIPKYTRDLHDGEDTALPLDDPDFSAKDVFDNPDDPLARRVIEKTADWNAMGITNIVDAYAPIVIYVGGAVALHNEELVLDPIRDRVQDLVFANVPDIQLTTLGDDVVLKGAVASAITGGTGDRSNAY